MGPGSWEKIGELKVEDSYASCFWWCSPIYLTTHIQRLRTLTALGGHICKKYGIKKIWAPLWGQEVEKKNRRSESWRLICIMFSGLSCRCVFLPWNSMDVLLSKTGNTSPKWDVSTKKMGGSPECASFYAQKCPTKSKPYLRMMCARTQHLNSHKIVCYWNQVCLILTKLFFKFNLTFFQT